MRPKSVLQALTIACSTVVLLFSCLSLEEFGTLFDAGISGQSATLESKQAEADRDDENWDIIELDTAREVSYLSNVEKRVIFELNKVRTNPKKYADLYLVPELKYYQGKEYRYPGRTTLITSEGKTAVEDCIKTLSSIKPMNALMPSDVLSLAARDHVQDTGPKGIIGHTGSDGSSLVSRIQRYDKTRRPVAETISYGHDNPHEIIKSLVIDDGVLGRGHRRIILVPEYDSAGLSIGNHSKYQSICVIDFAKYR